MTSSHHVTAIPLHLPHQLNLADAAYIREKQMQMIRTKTITCQDYFMLKNLLRNIRNRQLPHQRILENILPVCRSQLNVKIALTNRMCTHNQIRLHFLHLARKFFKLHEAELTLAQTLVTERASYTTRAFLPSFLIEKVYDCTG